MVAFKKIVIITMILVFVDAVIQEVSGGIILQGDSYTLIQLILLFFQLILAFAGLIIHAITHADLETVAADFSLLVIGLLSIIFFLLGSIVELLLHLISLPFELIGSFLEEGGFAFALYIDLWAFGFILIDFRSLTFMVQIGNIDVDILWGALDIVIQNKIGFSLLGASSIDCKCYVLSATNIANLGLPQVKEEIFPSYLVDKFISVFIELDDYVTGSVLGEPIAIGISNLGLNVSLSDLFEDILTDVGVPKLIDWIRDVWTSIGLMVEPTNSSNIQYLLYQIQQVVYHVKKR